MSSTEPWMFTPSPTAWPTASASSMLKNSVWSTNWSAGHTTTTTTTPHNQKSVRPGKTSHQTTNTPSPRSTTTTPNGDVATLTPKFDSMSFVSKNDAKAWSEPADGGRRKKKPQKSSPNSSGHEEETTEEEGSKQNLYKTELCRSFTETGTCRYGHKCQFAHGQHELRPVARHPKYKTETCKKFASTGHCPYGTRCRFIHPPPVAAPAVANLAAEIIEAPKAPTGIVWTNSWSSVAQGDDLKADEDHPHRLAVFQTISPED